MATITLNGSADEHDFGKEWKAINWKSITKDIFKMQKRISQAEKGGNYRKAKQLTRLLLNSDKTLLYSIKAVTEINKGRNTPGIDGFLARTGADRMKLFYQMKDMNIKLHKPKPVKRVYIHKKNGKLRPLGIPTIKDRVYQELCKLALEPAFEPKFEFTSYGFRPTKGVPDAVAKIFSYIKGMKRPYIFEGDFKACFDNLNHEFILDKLGNFPLKNLIKDWLEAGYLEEDMYNPTSKGTPQGGIISPILANIALHGLDEALGIKYKTYKLKNGNITYYNSLSKYVMVRYADDFVILCKNKNDAKEVYTLLESYLEDRGISLSEEKTCITHIRKGFDFLGVHFQSYGSKDKVLTRPSKDSQKRFKNKVRALAKKYRNGNIEEFIKELNSLIKGTAQFWRMTAAKEIFNKMDYFIYKTVRRLLKRIHPNKSYTWIKRKYFRTDYTGKSKGKYFLTCPSDPELQLRKMAEHKIEYARLIKNGVNPFNPEDNDYYIKIKGKSAYDCLYKKRK